MITAINDRNFLYVMCCLLIVNFTNMPNPIFEPLSRYLSIEKPDYACMINGKWGSGKTYFLLEELNSLLKNNDKDEIQELKIRYVSANGVKDFDEILDELKRQKIIPETSSKVKLVGKFAGRVIDNLPVGLIANVIVPGSGHIVDKTKDDLKKIFKKEDISEIIKAVSFNEKDIIIIDDLERVHKDCDLIGLIGEINTEFVEHQKIKTLFVCDEAQLKKRFCDNDRKLKGTESNYIESKEKVISYTFYFKNDIKDVLSGVCPKQLYKFLESNELIEELASDCRSYYCENLRTIKFFLNTLNEYLSTIGDAKCNLVFSRVAPHLLYDTIKFREGRNPSKDPQNLKEQNSTDHQISSQFLIESYEDKTLIYLHKLLINKELNKIGLIDETDNLIEYYNMDSPEYAAFKSIKAYQTLENNEFLSIFNKVDLYINDGRYNLFQIAEFLLIVEKVITFGVPFSQLLNHEIAINYFDKAFDKVPIKPRIHKGMDSLAHTSKFMDKHLENTLYNGLKEKFKRLLKSQARKDNAYLNKNTINKVISRGYFDNELRELEAILNTCNSFEDLNPLIKIYNNSNKFKESFALQIPNRIGNIISDIPYKSYLHQFFDIVSKDPEAQSFPSSVHLKRLSIQIEEFITHLKDHGKIK